MVVTCNTKDNSFVLRNTFDLISPFARDLDCSFRRLSASTRRQDPVIAKKPGHKLRELGVYIVVECAGDRGTLGSGEDDGERLIVSGREILFSQQGGFRAGSAVGYGLVWHIGLHGEREAMIDGR
ncbi:hypothetical protein GB937_009559 [Aspergillus fischeri]|nr:hypothetical protein GB937_009559 [Aspergillus fischeri]